MDLDLETPWRRYREVNFPHTAERWCQAQRHLIWDYSVAYIPYSRKRIASVINFTSPQLVNYKGFQGLIDIRATVAQSNVLPHDLVKLDVEAEGGRGGCADGAWHSTQMRGLARSTVWN